jgi:hypothetical protein
VLIFGLTLFALICNDLPGLLKKLSGLNLALCLFLKPAPFAVNVQLTRTFSFFLASGTLP